MNNPTRLKFLLIIACGGFLAGIVSSHELWFPVMRTFPRVPIFLELPEEIILFSERLLSGVLVISLLAVIFIKRRSFFLISILASLLLLISLDQNRLQPWVYQYSLMLLVFAVTKDSKAADESDSSVAFGLLQLLIAGLYFWSGIQKMNFTFAHETFSFLLAPIENVFPAIKSFFPFLAIVAAITESLLGIVLLFRRTRNLAVVGTVVMHLIILTLLIFKNYNSIVWSWNAVLIAAVIAAFWKNDVSIRTLISENNFSHWKIRAAKIIVVLSLILPILSFAGWWDLYLSGALYSGSTETAVLRVNGEILEKLPPTAKLTVFQPQNGKFTVLPFFEWAMNDLNVPVSPERRVFKHTGREICRLTGDKNGVELIIKERPAIADGNYKVTRITCAELEK